MTDLDDHSFAHELHDLLERSVYDVHATVPLLLAGSQDEGRRTIRARRRAIAVGAVAAAAAVVVIVPATLRLTAPADPDGAVTAGTPADSIPAITPTPDTGRQQYLVDSQSGESLEAPGLSTRMQELVPEGVLVLGPMTLSTTAAGDYASVQQRVLRPGAGSGQVRLTQSASEQVPACPSTLGRAATCSVLRDTDGAKVGTRSTRTVADLTINQVAMMLPVTVGGSTTVTVANTDDERIGPRATSVGTTPPLSLDELVNTVAKGTDTLLQP